MPSPSRVREVGRLAPEDLAVALVEQAAHAVNFSHPDGWRAYRVWLDGALSPMAPDSLPGCGWSEYAGAPCDPCLPHAR